MGNGQVERRLPPSSNSNLSHTRRDQLLLFHLIFSIRKRHGIKASDDVPMDASPIAPLVISSTSSPSPLPSYISTPVHLVSRFVPDKCIFILTLKKSNNILGKVHFRPTLYNPNLVQHVGDFCFGNARPINSAVGKVIKKNNSY